LASVVDIIVLKIYKNALMKGGVMEDSPENGCFQHLYVKYFNEIVKFITGIIYDRFAAEDLAHDLFCRLYRRRNSIDYNNDGIEGYIFRSAKNISIDYLRKLKRDEAREEKIKREWRESLSINYSEVENNLLMDELSTTVKDVLEEFPKAQRYIFSERVFNGKKLFELCNEMNISSYRIRKIESRIRKRLAEKLSSVVDRKIF